MLACQISAITAQDLLFGPTLRRFPDLKVALSEGGIGWIPFYFDRIDRHSRTRRGSHDDFGGKLPRKCSATTSSPATSPTRPGCCSATASASTTSPGSATTRTPTPPGPNHPSSLGRSCRTPAARDEEIHKITWENACRFFNWDPFKHTPQEEATVGALRSLATDVDTTRRPREEWKKRNEAAGIGVFEEMV